MQLCTEPHIFAHCHILDAHEAPVAFTRAKQWQRMRREAAATGQDWHCWADRSHFCDEFPTPHHHIPAACLLIELLWNWKLLGQIEQLVGLCLDLWQTVFLGLYSCYFKTRFASWLKRTFEKDNWWWKNKQKCRNSDEYLFCLIAWNSGVRVGNPFNVFFIMWHTKGDSVG